MERTSKSESHFLENKTHNPGIGNKRELKYTKIRMKKQKHLRELYMQT